MQQPTFLEYLNTLKIKSYHGEEATVLLKNIIAYIRPTRRKDVSGGNNKFQDFIAILNSDTILKQSFANLVATIIIEHNVSDMLTDSGLVTGATFAQQAKRIINEKFIPAYQEPTEITTAIQKVFFKKWDWQWIAAIPNESLIPIINQINDAIKHQINDLNVELCNAAKVTSYRIASLGLEKEILIRANKKEELITPFTQQNVELINFFSSAASDKETALNELRITLIKCTKSLGELEKNSIETGTSINQTFLLRRLSQNINRLKFIISFLNKNKAINANSIVHFIKDGIYDLKTKNNLKNFASSNLNLLAFRIVDHTKDTGENYITSTRSEYWKMFAAACGGGFIVSIMVMLKFKIGTLHLPLFWEGFMYSANYALGFIIIQFLRFTIATKQPAMTASTLANSLKGTSRKDFVQMAITVSRVSRTQFVSILGNVLMVIPFTLIWLFLYEKVFNSSFLSVDAAHKQLIANHPKYSASILYAAIAGLFLFLSGIVSGYVENRIVYARIGDRLPNQPILKKIIPKKWLPKLVLFLQKRSGAIFGNATLGILLGMASFFGKIFGLPIDIRHITFAAGNIAMGIFGGGTDNINLIIGCISCIIIIGLLNLFVSFSLAFYVAMKARNLHLSDYPELSKMVFKHFISTPREFFFPTKRGKSAFAEKQEDALFKNDLGIE
jgi:site-specific recombinase